jgi:hypothetical protein
LSSTKPSAVDSVAEAAVVVVVHRHVVVHRLRLHRRHAVVVVAVDEDAKQSWR